MSASMGRDAALRRSFLFWLMTGIQAIFFFRILL